jgi:hypothetical protein
MNNPDPSEYEVQDPKRVRPQALPTLEDPYSIEDARMDRSKQGSWSTRATALIVTALIFNVLNGFILISDFVRFGPLSSIANGCFGIFLGLLICQYSAVWIWMQLYIPERLARIILAGFLTSAITFSGTLGYLIRLFYGWAVIGAPWYRFAAMSVMFLIAAIVFYWLHSWFLGLFLKRTDLNVEFQFNRSNRYSIPRILGFLLVIEIVSYLFKYLVANGLSPSLSNLAVDFSWIFCTAFWTALIVYLQLASRFALVPQKFRWRWWLAVILAPVLFLLSVEFLSKIMDPTYPQLGFLAAIPLIYFVEFGLVIGTWIQLRMIPRGDSNRVHEPT